LAGALLIGVFPWRLVAARPDGHRIFAAPNTTAPPRPGGTNSASAPDVAAGYDIVDLGTLGGNYSEAYAINDRGQVVGVANPSPNRPRGRAFLWQNGQMADLGVLGGDRRSMGVDINNGGRIVAGSFDAYEYHHAFFWDNTKRALKPAVPGYRYARAQGVNDYGEVVGNVQTGRRDAGGALAARAFLWVEGHTIDLGTLGGRFSHAHAINNRGRSSARPSCSSGDVHGGACSARRTRFCGNRTDRAKRAPCATWACCPAAGTARPWT
jgi:probable HAF family extracellular repeat protein